SGCSRKNARGTSAPVLSGPAEDIEGAGLFSASEVFAFEVLGFDFEAVLERSEGEVLGAGPLWVGNPCLSIRRLVEELGDSAQEQRRQPACVKAAGRQDPG